MKFQHLYMAEDLESLTVSELKEILKQENLPVSGKKNDLIARLRENNSSVAQIKIPLYNQNKFWRRLKDKTWRLKEDMYSLLFIFFLLLLSTDH